MIDGLDSEEDSCWQVKLSAGDYGGATIVMKVIGNVFSGGETQFTADEADATNLVWKNNYYLGNN